MGDCRIFCTQKKIMESSSEGVSFHSFFYSVKRVAGKEEAG
jgi:hypothetical protein